MKKILKYLLVIGCALCVFLNFVACDKNNNDNDGDPAAEIVTYTVMVSCGDHGVIDGVKVKLVKEDGTDATEAVALTGGFVQIDAPAGAYTVKLVGVPDTHNVSEEFLTATVKSATVNVTSKQDGNQQINGNIVYRITLQDPEGKPVEGKIVQLCDLAGCHDGITDANGVAELSLKAGNYEVHVNQVPAGWKFDNTKYTVSATKTTLTVAYEEMEMKNYKVTVACAGDQQASVEGIIVSLHRNLSGVISAEGINGATNASGVAIIEAEKGEYNIRLSNYPSGYGYDLNLIIDGSEKNPKINITLYKAGNSFRYPLLINEGNNKITVTPEALTAGVWVEYVYDGKSGKYGLETTGDLNTSAKHYLDAGGGYQSAAVTEELSKYFSYNEDKSAEDKNFYMEFGIEPEYAQGNNKFIFEIKAAGEEVADAQEINLKVTYIENIEGVVIETVFPHATQIINGLTPFAASYDFVHIAPDDGEIVFNENDGLYHWNTLDGEVIYVVIESKKHVPLVFGMGFLSAFEDGASYVLYNKELTVRSDYIEMIKEYAAACANADGIHPLTKEMKDFLQAYAENNMMYVYFDDGGWEKGSEELYFFACGYCVEK